MRHLAWTLAASLGLGAASWADDEAKPDAKATGAPDAVKAPAELAGSWTGDLELHNGLSLRLVLVVEPDAAGTHRAWLVSPDQTDVQIPLSSIELDGETLRFESKRIRAKFEGRRKGTDAAYSGTFTQSGKLKLTLTKAEGPVERPRPQTPKPPFPYRSEDVTYRNEAADLTLAGTLTTPEGDGPFPAVLLITGSGAQDRDETLFGHKPFLILADDLSRRGVAVLRVDDRGVGGSTGSASEATSADFAVDVETGIDFLKTHPRVDPKRIGLVGHSEGGLIAPMVAARRDDVAFIVLLAGTGLPGEEILRMQSRLIAQAMGASPIALAINDGVLRGLIARARQGEDRKPALEALAKLPGADKLEGPWMRFFLDYDPRPALAKVRCPVLAINGEKDLQVPPKENLEAIAEALRSGGNERVTIRELPGLNHLFQTCETGALSEYAKIEQSFAPEALEVIGAWIAEQVGDGR